MGKATYKAGELSKEFKGLERIDSHVFIPMFDIVFSKFLEKIGTFPTRYKVTDAIRLNGTSWHSFRYVIAIGGKIIIISTSWEDIDVIDEDETWWMIKEINLEGDDKALSKFFTVFRNFIKKQELGELIEAVVTELRKGKTYHLSSEMKDFYLNSTIKDFYLSLK